ncbi:hypothetical protein HPB51_005424 [Rhipicephalus microplus]|uniref:SKI/SNO/DAC domain-containing protein n=1 Tax=Rhipicephalus microplus TaxID=6941 RepID=A0A9J6DTC5_RHIMP|nr:hypothetical protein HPB51_005424 [Rhipicephalus microplus]
MDAGSLGSCSSGGGTPSPPTLTFGSPAAAAHSPSARSSPKSGFGSMTPTRSTPESPLGAALPLPPPPKQPGYGVLHALNGGRALYGAMRPAAAFELFLKHLVGGLHTVYTKLKRLDITPIVCNVEQVRILRGLGAIQPGVNRCKLLSCKDFDSLYKDCTTAREKHVGAHTSRLGKRFSRSSICRIVAAFAYSQYRSFSLGVISRRQAAGCSEHQL